MALYAKKVQDAKTKAIKDAKETLSEYNDFIFADYRGMTVEQITRLRKKLREQNATLKVMKNNFARIAFEQMEIDNVAEYLKGPTVIAMSKEDSNVVAKTLFDFAKEVPVLSVKGACVDKEILDAAKIEAYSKVPGKKELIAMLMSAINGPARQLAATIKAYAEKKEAEGDKPAATEATASKAEAEEPAKTEEKAEAAPAPEADAPSAE
ncbi:MAG: 50S ribosomal protein L10 [Treponemataceae bacterium]|nr:50S ribosomal protein L10 [Treponemataceae bacterium]